MKIYRISATQGNISFKQDIRAISSQDAINKFKIDIGENNNIFMASYDNVNIDSIHMCGIV